MSKNNSNVRCRLATAWLDGCSGCHMSLLDLDEALLQIAPRIDLVYSPLMDAQTFPGGVDVALVEGAVSNQADIELATEIRANSSFVVALGDCAVTGNVPSMRNTIPVRTLLERVYTNEADNRATVPDIGVPVLARHVLPLHDVIRVDLHVPGCPPKAATIGYVISQLLDGKKPNIFGQVQFG